MFALWVFALPHIRLALSVDEGTAIKWMGIGLAIIAGLGAVWNSAALPQLYARLGHAGTHVVSLCAGGAGLYVIASAHTAVTLVAGFLAVGIAWASISNTPYALVSARVADGHYERAMARFNFSVVIPQVALALSLGWLIGGVSPSQAIAAGAGAMAGAALIMFVAARTSLRN